MHLHLQSLPGGAPQHEHRPALRRAQVGHPHVQGMPPAAPQQPHGAIIARTPTKPVRAAVVRPQVSERVSCQTFSPEKLAKPVLGPSLINTLAL
jgi:hypothetical protein